MISIAVPPELEAVVAAIRAWAKCEPLVNAVFLFGSRLRRTSRLDSDLDIAVSIADAEEMLQAWIDNKQRWQEALSSCTHFLVDLDIADSGLAPNVWAYLQSGSARIYDIEGVCDKTNHFCNMDASRY
jgi:predicted nucleotidyltransferase